MTELIWEGKYDKDGRRVAPLRVALPFQTVETVNESAQERQRMLDLFGTDEASGRCKMNEEERAKYLEEHKDDPEIWEAVPDAPWAPRRQGLSATITVRFSPEEAAGIRAMAKRYDLSYSEVVRRAVQNLIQPRFSYRADRIDFRLYNEGQAPAREDRVDFPRTAGPRSTGRLAQSV